MFSATMLAGFFAWTAAADVPAKPTSPLSPREELATFKVNPGFRVELAAAEPDVIDPIALAFDEHGRMFVMEMRGYPNKGVGTGKPVLPGRIKVLEDKDSDGYFEVSKVFVDELRFPTGLTPWKGGLLIGDAPDLIYCKDTDGDGKADVRKTLYTGFGVKNIQQLVNSLQFHVDNWIHGCNGLNESVIRSVEKPDAPAVELRSRHIRFKPDVPASLEPTSGGGQYGLASDQWGNWFTCTNSEHLRHIVLPDHYLRRNPYLTVQSVVLDIPDKVDEHNAAAKLYRISPFEAWRVDRTQRRVTNPMGRRFASTELVPGGYTTSATGLMVYHGGSFPPEYNGNVFAGDPANNLIHRDVLVPDGPTFIAKRGDKDHEFFASTDNWCRPVFLCQGPDGAIYFADFYREVIETPLSLPEDIQQKYNLQSRQRGRIWRIVHKDATPQKASLGSDLIVELSSSNSWRRITAQRLLIEKQSDSPELIAALKRFARAPQPPTARLHALWTLEGLGKLDPDTIEKGLRTEGADIGAAGIREHSLRLAEPLLALGAKEVRLRDAVLALVDDSSARVRFQLAFTLGQLGWRGSPPPNPRVAAALTKLTRTDGADRWTQTAILSSSLPYASAMLTELMTDKQIPDQLLGRLAAVVAGKRNEDEINRTLTALTQSAARPGPRQIAMLAHLGQSLARQPGSLAERMAEKSEAAERLNQWWKQIIAMTAANATRHSERLELIRLLGYGPFSASAPALEKFLTPQTAADFQLAAIQSLSAIREPAVAEILLAEWPGYSPNVRREVQEAVFARADRVPHLLTAIEKGQVLAAQLDQARREQLLKHRDAAIRTRAEKLFASQVPEERKKVVEAHRPALELQADAARGKLVFTKNCSTCHRLEDVGFEVGPNLLATLKNKNRETLLIDILDPSREVDPRYMNYVAQTRAGTLVTGLIASETSTNYLLRRAERAEDTILRSDIEELRSTAKSLMPEGLEKQMSQQELADLIAYLQKAAG